MFPFHPNRELPRGGAVGVSLGAITLLGVLLGLAACTASSDSIPRDLERWEVSAEPRAVIGEMAGDSAYLFQRVIAASLLDDGRIVVGDAGLSVIRVFEADGTFVGQMGGQGEGPGEFMSLRSVWIAGGDTIGAWDSGTLRLTYYRPDGSLVRTVALVPSTDAGGVGRLDLAVGPLQDGSVAVGSITAGSPQGTGRDRISVERFGPEGEHLERITEVTGFVRGPGGPGPFTPYPYFATHGDHVYYTNGKTPAVRVWDVTALSGDGPQAVLQLPPSTNDAGAAWDSLAPILERRRNESGLSFLERAQRSDSIPHLAGLVVDDAGRSWTKRYEAPYDGLILDGGPRVRGGRWWVADPGEGLTAEAVVPDGLILLDVWGDTVVGLTVDELGVERLQIHDVHRSPADPT